MRNGNGKTLEYNLQPTSTKNVKKINQNGLNVN